MGEPDGLSRRSWKEKSGKDGDFVYERQLLNLENNNITQEDNAEDVELEAIVMARWEKKNGLWVVLQERRLEVLCWHNNSEVAAHQGRYWTQELIAGYLIWNRWSEEVA